MGLDERSDEELLARIRDGSEEAFTTLYRRRQGNVYRFAFGMTGSEAIAEETVQEVFLAVLNGEAAFDASRGRLSAFLLGVARNHVLRALRRDGRYTGPVEETVEREQGRSDLVEAVQQAVLTLPERYREVVALCDLEEMDYAAAAEALECPVGTVRSRLHRARGLLAEKLAAQGLVRSMS